MKQGYTDPLAYSWHPTITRFMLHIFSFRISKLHFIRIKIPIAYVIKSDAYRTC